ncbi:hypothetical protein C8Q77DRAFT_170963 [Trametes polyzona]|nr:hypothetical protein C8Q77DRAFT_170963 [Trametes polyzona]
MGPLSLGGKVDSKHGQTLSRSQALPVTSIRCLHLLVASGCSARHLGPLPIARRHRSQRRCGVNPRPHSRRRAHNSRGADANVAECPSGGGVSETASFSARGMRAEGATQRWPDHNEADRKAAAAETRSTKWGDPATATYPPLDTTGYPARRRGPVLGPRAGTDVRATVGAGGVRHTMGHRCIELIAVDATSRWHIASAFDDDLRRARQVPGGC